MCILAVDLEGSIHNDQVGDFSGDPSSTKNFIVWAGVKVDGKPTQCTRTKDVPAPGKNDIVVMQNAAYDLILLCNTNNKYAADWLAWVRAPSSRLWDTMVAEYILSGHTLKMQSLDVMSKRYGLPTKDSNIKEYWKNGISTEDIPEEEIVPYCIQDVDNTYRIFAAQAKACSKDVLRRMRLNGDALLATIEMRINGFRFDRGAALSYLEGELQPKLEQYAAKCTELMAELTGVPIEHVNPASNKQLTALIFGGEVKYTEKRVMLDAVGLPLLFKSGAKKGQVRTKNEEVTVQLSSIGALPKRILNAGNADKNVIGELMEVKGLPEKFQQFLSTLAEYKKLAKLASTYFEGYSSLVWPDGMIRGSYNHALTSTGRLSSSKPNLQNAGHSIIRKFFVSRFKGGKLLEADLSQIEVVMQAYLSQDYQMMLDIKNGVDFHSKRAAYAAGDTYENVLAKVEAKDPKWVAIRRSAKSISFQKAYGAGVRATAQSLNMPEAEVKKIFEAEDATYPRVAQTKQGWYEQVESSKWSDGENIYGKLPNLFGGEFWFQQEDSYGRGLEFGYTKVINYPIQGSCAELMKLLIREVRNYLYEKYPTVKLANTVHDSVVMDVPPGVDVDALAKSIVSIMQHLPQVMKLDFNIDFNLPITGECEVSDTWYKEK